MSSKTVRTRMAPSPTGFLHVGGLRTALYDYLYARQQQGKFVLRIEDTDQNRLVEGALENIVQSLAAFGLQPDEGPVWSDGKIAEQGDHGPYFQSKRLEIYGKHAQQLLEQGQAYYCFCSPERLDQLRAEQQAHKLPPKYDKHCLNLEPQVVAEKIAAGEKHVIRLNVPADKTITFADVVHGEISISSNDIDDQVLIKSDGFPTYHLAVVVDDHLMEISHVIRGDEWISSTPKHVLLYQAFGWDLPQFVHLPLLLSKSRKKLSKRDGDVAVRDFLAQGYLPEALLNFVAFLGWNPKSEQEVFSLDELVKEFKLENINKAGAVFDLEKLDWLNGLYIRKMPVAELAEKVKPYLTAAQIKFENFSADFLAAVVALEQERLKKLGEIGERVRYFFEAPEYQPELLIWKKSTKEAVHNNLQALYSHMQNLPPDKFSKTELEKSITEFISAGDLSNGEVLWPLRAALSGLAASPGPFEIMEAFGKLPNGKDLILQRINTAIEKTF